jgi:hypothetical protein
MLVTNNMQEVVDNYEVSFTNAECSLARCVSFSLL